MKNQFLTKQVTDDLQVVIIPDKYHEFLMASKEVAKGYGINVSTLRSHKARYQAEFIEGKHFLRSVAISNASSITGITNTTMWTKRGIVRLGFFIKSQRAKLFRDWVEDLVINVIEQKLPALPDAPRRKHNRLTPERMIDLMADICQIEDASIRLSIVNKLIN